MSGYSNLTGLPSPSDVLRPWVNADFFTEESRERGNAVHQACADELLGRYAVIDSRWRGYLDSFRRWRDHFEPRVLAVEERMSDTSYGFCGQPDLGCSIDGKFGIGIIDFKTSKSLGKAWPLQIAAYERLIVRYGWKSTWGASVRLNENGALPKTKFYTDFELRFNIFLGCLNAYKHFNG